MRKLRLREASNLPSVSWPERHVSQQHGLLLTLVLPDFEKENQPALHHSPRGPWLGSLVGFIFLQASFKTKAKHIILGATNRATAEIIII